MIEPIFEADFDEAAYGYRPRRSAHEAIRVVHKALDDGRSEVVDADLSQYFGTIPHAALMACLARRISDGRMLHLLKGWLKAPVVEPDELSARMSGGKRAARGTPQGGVVSPLLANIYMHRYIKAFRRSGLDRTYGAQLVTYADDLVVLCRRGAHEILEKTRGWMTSIGLALNEGKTSVRDARCESFDFLGYTFGPMYSPRTGGHVRLTWRPKPVEAAGVAAVLQARAEVLHRVGEQTVETRASVDLEVLRAPMKSFRVRFPATARVLKVEGPDIRAWEDAEAGGGRRELRIDLHNEVLGSWGGSFDLETPRVEGVATADLPTLVFEGASRESGFEAVAAASPVSVRPAARSRSS